MQNQQSQEDTCAICLNTINSGGRQALFTAECSHTFHFQCISSNVAHGNLVCPLCMAHWKELPFGAPLNNPSRTPFYPAHEPRVFNDDDPVDPLPETMQVDTLQQSTGTSGTMEVKTFTECPAVAKSSSKDDFAIVIHLTAPGMASGMPESTRAPLDLVTVLDVSGSMCGAKLSLLKQAMTFVIQNLGPADRLSIVSFSSMARRLIRLTRMSSEGVQQALNAVNSLAAGGGTNIAEGLRRGAKILEECQYKNPVNSIILLSDGQDTYTVATNNSPAASEYDCLLPASILHPVSRAIPIHTFGFGSDHDALAMHRIAEASGGSFSFIEDASSIQDAFAQCIGGLLSVVAQDTRIALASADHDVKISKIKSGSYESCVENGGTNGSISVGDLYADEQRCFLLFVNVPRSDIDESTKLIKVKATYKEATTAATVEVAEQEVSIERPETVPENQTISIDVERERVRVQAMEDMVAARVAAERGEMRQAVEILANRERAVETSVAAEGGNVSCQQLQIELKEMKMRMKSREDYERSGRAFTLAGLSSHRQQRATTRSSMREPMFGNSPVSVSEPSVSYQTPAMARMVSKSQSLLNPMPSDLPDNLP